MNLAIFAYSHTGCGTARRVLAALPEAHAKCYAAARSAAAAPQKALTPGQTS